MYHLKEGAESKGERKFFLEFREVVAGKGSREVSYS
jgi:hypothetical protein